MMFFKRDDGEWVSKGKDGKWVESKGNETYIDQPRGVAFSFSAKLTFKDRCAIIWNVLRNKEITFSYHEKNENP